MNQLCRVCGEPAAGFHFGAFTCEGCKSFFGRTYNNLSQIHECKNGGSCVINKQNRTSCKACRLKKCLVVGMSKSGSKYGRRSNWFKIHCLLQEQAAQVNKNFEGVGGNQDSIGGNPNPHMLSLSPTPMTSLSPGQTEEEGKIETSSALSSPESIASECSNDIHQRGGRRNQGFLGGPLQREAIMREGVPGGDFVANLGLYSLHPGLSLLHASQFYSRLYPPVLYPALTHPHLLQATQTPTPRSPPLPSSSPHSSTSSKHRLSQSRSPSSSPESNPRPPPPSPPYSLQPASPTPNSPFTPRKRGAESPLEDFIRPWHSSSTTEQDAPIDLRVKRRRMSTNSTFAIRPETETPPQSSAAPIMTILPLSTINSTPVTPVNLTSSA